MNDDNNALENRLTDLIRRVTDTPLPVANAVSVFFEKNNLTAADIRVLVMKGAQSNLFSLVEENRELRAEVNRLKAAHGLKWSEFVAVCASKVDVNDKRWRQVIASHFGYSMNTLTEWEREDRVPYLVLKKIEDLPDLRGEPKPHQNLSRAVGALVRNLRARGVRPEQISSWLLSLYEAADTETLRKLIDEALTEPAPVSPKETVKEPTQPRKQRSYETLRHQNQLLLRILAMVHKRITWRMDRDEMIRLATDLWGENFRKPLADLLHLTTVNINNILPSGRIGKVFNKPPAYFWVLRLVHSLVLEHGWSLQDFIPPADEEESQDDSSSNTMSG
jgi:hypothetical protein